MARRKLILIGCPQYRVLVRGTCACDEEGRYLRAADGEFLLHHIRCDQRGGRCMQTLCVLHRYNRRSTGSWYPSGIWAMNDIRKQHPSEALPAPDGGWYV